MNSTVSVIIPARQELYLRETIADLFQNAQDEIEVLVVLDGWQPDYKIKRRKGLRILRNRTVKGMRGCINKAAAVAKGDYLMKLDAHCTIGEGWDALLKADCADNWIVVPRRYWWDAPAWDFWQREPVDIMTYIYPFNPQPYKPRLTCRPDNTKADDNQKMQEDMGFQGSMWFMHKAHFVERLGGMSEQGYGTFAEDPQELGLKTQLGPWQGKVMRNKKTWYAHWYKSGREAHRFNERELDAGYRYAWDFWWNNRWPERGRDFIDLVEAWEPLYGWPANWRWLVTQYNRFDLNEIWRT